MRQEGVNRSSDKMQYVISYIQYSLILLMGIIVWDALNHTKPKTHSKLEDANKAVSMSIGMRVSK